MDLPHHGDIGVHGQTCMTKPSLDTIDAFIGRGVNPNYHLQELV